MREYAKLSFQPFQPICWSKHWKKYTTVSSWLIPTFFGKINTQAQPSIYCTSFESCLGCNRWNNHHFRFQEIQHVLTTFTDKNCQKKSRTFTKKAGCRRQSKSSPLSIHKTLNLLTLTQLQPSHPKHYIVCFILLFCHYLHGGLSPTNLVRMQIQSQLSPGGESAGTVIPPPRHPQLRPAGPSHASPWQFAAAHLDSSGRESKM